MKTGKEQQIDTNEVLAPNNLGKFSQP